MLSIEAYEGVIVVAADVSDYNQKTNNQFSARGINILTRSKFIPILKSVYKMCK